VCKTDRRFGPNALRKTPLFFRFVLYDVEVSFFRSHFCATNLVRFGDLN